MTVINPIQSSSNLLCTRTAQLVYTQPFNLSTYKSSNFTKLLLHNTGSTEEEILLTKLTLLGLHVSPTINKISNTHISDSGTSRVNVHACECGCVCACVHICECVRV